MSIEWVLQIVPNSLFVRTRAPLRESSSESKQAKDQGVAARAIRMI